MELHHRIKVLLYRLEHGRPHYLLLRRSEGVAPPWGLLDGPIGFDEQIEAAIRREVLEDVGLPGTDQVIDLQMPKHWLVGDEEVVEWPYGARAPVAVRPLVLDRRWADYRWAEFGEAYTELQLELDRAAVTRLHTLITAA
jgi:predicted NUDIX family NTP pyrophosphohydrolase